MKGRSKLSIAIPGAIAVALLGCTATQEPTEAMLEGKAPYSGVYYGYAPVALAAQDGRINDYPVSAVFYPDGKSLLMTYQVPGSVHSVSATGEMSSEGVFIGEFPGQFRGVIYHYGSVIEARFQKGGQEVEVVTGTRGRKIRNLQSEGRVRPFTLYSEASARGANLARKFKNMGPIPDALDDRVKEPHYSVQSFPWKTPIAVSGVLYSQGRSRARKGSIILVPFAGWDTAGNPRRNFSKILYVPAAELPPNLGKGDVLSVPKTNPLTVYKRNPFSGGTIVYAGFYDPKASRRLTVYRFPEVPELTP